MMTAEEWWGDFSPVPTNDGPAPKGQKQTPPKIEDQQQSAPAHEQNLTGTKTIKGIKLKFGAPK